MLYTYDTSQLNCLCHVVFAAGMEMVKGIRPVVIQHGQPIDTQQQQLSGQQQQQQQQQQQATSNNSNVDLNSVEKRCLY